MHSESVLENEYGSPKTGTLEKDTPDGIFDVCKLARKAALL